MLLWLLGCAGADDAASMARLARASLDLRGVRPSLAELEAVREDPGALPEMVDAFLDDPRFEDRVVSLWAPVYLTRASEADASVAEFEEADEIAVVTSLGEEPLRVLAHIAATDMPYGTISTADWTMVDATLAAYYPVTVPAEWPEGATWQQATFTDTRPHLGVLATPGFHWRYRTTVSNANRGRANALSRILLCNDYLALDVAIDPTIDLSNEEAVADAVDSNPSCIACHQSLDPIAANFWGFYAFQSNSLREFASYHPSRSSYADLYSPAPAYYGVPTTSPDMLGDQVAADPRLPSCLTKQAYELLLHRAASVDDTDALVAHRDAFIEGGETVKALLRSILRSDAYNALPPDDDANLRTLSADQLASSIADLTGYRLTTDGHDTLGTDTLGLRSLAGGEGTGFDVEGAVLPTPTQTLVQATLAEAGAWSVATSDLADPDAAMLLTDVTGAETADSGEREVRAQLRLLHERVLSRQPSDDEVDSLFALWADSYISEGGATGAWASVIAALISSPDYLVY